MKKNTIMLSDSDIDTILFAVTENVNLKLEQSDMQRMINTKIRINVCEKLAKRDLRFDENELRIIFTSLDVCRLISTQEIPASIELQRSCSQRIFTLNKLSAQFFKFMPDDFS